MYHLKPVHKNHHMTIFTLFIFKPPGTRSVCFKSIDLIARKILRSEN